MAAICSEVTHFPSTSCRPQALTVGALPEDNRLLAAMPPRVRERLFPRLQRIWLPLGRSLHQPGDCIRHVYFPTDAVVSLSATTDDGTSTEIAAIGNEGLVGLSVIMGGESSPTRAMTVDAGCAFGISRASLMELFHDDIDVQQLLLRYAQVHLIQVTQLAVCNRRHSAEQQFCRWLLLRLDRASSRCLNATHEAVANMLGVRRETISQVAGRLQRQDAIQLSRGKLEVVDRELIETLSCECYFAVRKETERLLPHPRHDNGRCSIDGDRVVRIRPGSHSVWPTLAGTG